MILSRDDILKRDALPTRDVDVPEWGEGEKVRVRCLTAAGRLEFGIASQKAMAGEPAPNPSALLVALAAVDENGERLFTIQHSDALAELDGAVVDRVATAVMDLSGLSKDDNATAIEVAQGNSAAAPSGATPSDSPDNSDAPSPN